MLDKVELNQNKKLLCFQVIPSKESFHCISDYLLEMNFL
jgi:hypothetical protein